MATVKSELLTHMKAKYSIIALQTSEEPRAIRMIGEIAADPQTVKRSLKIGSITKGLYDPENEKPPEMCDPMSLLMAIESELSETKPAPTIYILLDLHEAITNEIPFRRKLRDLQTTLKAKNSTILLLSPTIEVHPDLSKTITVFDLPLPDKVELEEILCTRVKYLQKQVKTLRDEITSKPEQSAKIQKKLDTLVPITEALIKQATENKDAIVSALQGTTGIEADQTIAKCIVLKDLNISTILQEKKQIVKKSGALTYQETDETIDGIGGLKNLIKWGKSARNRFSETARKYGLIPPKGVIFVGAPGTGKTLSAKALSNLFKIPLLTLTMAEMTSKYYGQTGNNMIAAIKLAQAMSPCIVFIDEIDKMFGTSGGNEHEESARTRGALLTAMEESTGIFWLATCNQPTALAPELLARFPTVFHVDLPSSTERREIFNIHLKKINRDPAKFDLDRLIAASEGYVGREIRNALQEALGQSFDEGKEITTDHITAALKTITPTSIQRADDIGRIRKWCKTNARPANEQPEKPESPTTSEADLNKDLEL